MPRGHGHTNTFGVVASNDDLADRSLGLALRLAGDDDQLKLAALNNRAHLTAREGDPEAAVQMVKEAITIAERTGFRHREAALRNQLADLHHLAGREEAAEQVLIGAVSLFAEVGADELEPEVWLLSQW